MGGDNVYGKDVYTGQKKSKTMNLLMRVKLFFIAVSLLPSLAGAQLLERGEPFTPSVKECKRAIEKGVLVSRDEQLTWFFYDNKSYGVTIVGGFVCMAFRFQ